MIWRMIQPIICVAPNPALDLTLVVPDFEIGRVLRVTQAISAAGGKGVNVVRGIKILGGEALNAGFLGGYAGRQVADYAAIEGMRAEWTWITGETRTCIILVIDGATVVNEVGPTVTADDWHRLKATVLRASSQARQVCFSGSLPPGSPLGEFVDLARALVKAGKQVWVDTSGEPLAAVVPFGMMIKVNGDEAGAILGRKANGVSNAIQAAQEFLQRGAAGVALTLGEAGAVLAMGKQAWQAIPPPLQVVSAVGSGDTFLSGLVTGFAEGLPPGEALRRGVAAGTANALSSGGGFFTREEFDRVLAQTTVMEKLYATG
jgi:1-phosphofructokinase family hexose kinase